MQGKERKGFRKMLRVLDLPEEIEDGLVKFTMLGDCDLLVESHRGILQYQDETVRFVTRDGVVRVTGEALTLTEFGSERIYISGRIFGWMYEDRNGCGNR